MHRVPPELGFRGKKLQYLEQTLAHWLMSHGALVFMVPTIERSDAFPRANIRVRDYVHALDGLLLQGGADVSPETYGEAAQQPAWQGDRVRDLFEIDLLWECVIQKKPVLGICRGAQLINVAMGGTLYQDIELQHAQARRHVDRELYDEMHHSIRFETDSRLAALYPAAAATEPLVSSIHHQAVKDLGNGLAVEARAVEDGIVEAIRWSGASYVFGVQWHPEFHGPDRSGLLDSAPIVREFLDEAAVARGELPNLRRRETDR